MSRIFHEASPLPPPPLLLRQAFLQHSNIVWWLKRDVTRDIDYTWPRPTQLLYKSSHLRREKQRERERERVEKESARRDMMVRCLPQRATVFSFPLTRRSSQFLPPPTRSFRTNRGIKSDSNRLPFTSSIPPPPFPLFPSSRFSRSHWFFSPPTRFTMNDRETCVRRLRPILFPLLKFCLLFAQPRSLSLSIFERIFLDSFGLSLVY